MNKRAILTILLVAAMASGATAAEVTLSADADLAGGANLGSIAPSGTGTDVDPWVYTFSSDGLDTAAYSALLNNGESFTLNMGGFGITGVSGGVSLSSSRAAYGATVPAGDLAIYNVGNISIGAIETFSDASYWGQNSNSPGGDLTIGTSGQRAGNIRTDYINARADFNGKSGDVNIYSSGDVLLQTSGGVAGNLNGVPWGNAGTVNIDHDGAFTVANVDYYAFNSGGDGGSLTFNGDGLANGASGAFTSGVLSTYSGHATTSDLAGNITISGYTSVTIGGIQAHSLAADKWNTNPSGGDVTVSAEGDIKVLGEMNLDTTHGSAFDGFFSATATNGGGIELGDSANPGLANLDLDGFEYLFFDSSRYSDSNPVTEGESVIYHNILNFVAGGSEATPNTQLQVADDVDVIYYYYDETVNAGLYAGGDTGLGQGEYYIQSDGPLGLGLLAPLPAGAPVPEPATMLLLGIGGVAMVAVRRRRSR